MDSLKFYHPNLFDLLESLTAKVELSKIENEYSAVKCMEPLIIMTDFADVIVTDSYARHKSING